MTNIQLVLIIFADEYQSYLSGLQDTINEIQKDIGKRMYEICMRGKLPEASELLARDDVVRLKRCIFAQGTGYRYRKTNFVIFSEYRMKHNITLQII